MECESNIYLRVVNAAGAKRSVHDMEQQVRPCVLMSFFVVLVGKVMVLGGGGVASCRSVLKLFWVVPAH